LEGRREEPEKKMNAKMLLKEFQRICSLPLKFYDMKNVKASLWYSWVCLSVSTF
jgi:hypothetical protein